MKPAVTVEYKERMEQIFKNRSWLDQNIDSIKTKYHDSWIVVTGGKLVAAGALTASEAISAAGADFDPETSIVFQVPAKIQFIWQQNKPI